MNRLEGQQGMDAPPVGSVHQAVAAARDRLRAGGLSTAEADLSARALAEYALGWTTERLLADGHTPASPDFLGRYRALVSRRAGREPLAYIVGSREFWGMAFQVSPAVLIPRPETEILVEATLQRFPRAGERLALADACTGCGCVAVAIACERPAAHIVATDISAEALEVAHRNAVTYGVAGRIGFVRGDLLEPVAGPLDAIVANPPYVVAGARPALQPEVRDHEPSVALYGGADGLALIRRLVATAPTRLRPGGYLIFEFGFGQDPDVEALVAGTAGLELLELRRDLQGIARTAVARRSNASGLP